MRMIVYLAIVVFSLGGMTGIATGTRQTSLAMNSSSIAKNSMMQIIFGLAHEISKIMV
jgi:hypothetical protein